MKRQSTKLPKPRQNATKNPFIISHRFDILEETIENLGLKERPDLIWNLDESGVPHELKKCKTVSFKGQPRPQIITGSDRDNTTILAVVSGSGETLPPLIIFQGKQIQTSWLPSRKPDHTFYPWIYANEKGWMKSDIFYKWFVEWEKKTRSYTSDEKLEGRLVIYDGHLSRVGFSTLQCAHEWKVTILKLPLHTTDLLQPLDMSVFKALKQK